MRFQPRVVPAAFLVLVACLALTPFVSEAQIVTLPPSGENQRASVSQWIGPVEVNVTYSSPKVTAPDGTDRKGKIWGQLVPYGMAKEVFGTCGDQCPWRAGANEKTAFRISHDVLIEGKPLPAGTYGLHMIPGPEKWTIIFSKDATSWGSYSYKASEDALRVDVTPLKGEYHHWLTYEFTERKPDRATVALAWENLQVPWSVSVPNVTDLYVDILRRELRGPKGFNWEGWQEAAKFCVERKTNLKEALTWAENGVSLRFIGQENFFTLQTLADLQRANGLTADSEITMQKAIDLPGTRPVDIHQYGRSLLLQGEKEKALKVFETNARKNPGVWPVHVGLARGYASVGRTKEALKHAKLALAQAPDDLNRKGLQTMVENLEAGKPVK